jgi:two-component system uhpT operon response regulator UhpA
MCIDDNVLLVDALERRLGLEAGFSGMMRVEDFSRSVECVLDTRPTIVVLDVDLPGGADAMAILSGIVEKAPDSRVIMFTGHPTRALISRTMARGAWGFVSKGTTPDRLIDAIHRVQHGDVVIELDD